MELVRFSILFFFVLSIKKVEEQVTQMFLKTSFFEKSSRKQNLK